MPAVQCCPRCGMGWPEVRSHCGRCGASLANPVADSRAMGKALGRDWWAERTNPRELRLMAIGAVLGMAFYAPHLLFSGFAWRLAVPAAVSGILVVAFRLNHLASMLVGLGSFLILIVLLIGLVFDPFGWLLICGGSACIALHADHRRSLGTRSGWGVPAATTVVPERPDGAPPSGPGPGHH